MQHATADDFLSLRRDYAYQKLQEKNLAMTLTKLNNTAKRIQTINHTGRYITLRFRSKQSILRLYTSLTVSTNPVDSR